MRRAEPAALGNRRAGYRAGEVACERSDHIQPPGPGERCRTGGPSLHPADDGRHGERAAVSGLVEVAGERHQLRAWDREREAEAPTLLQVVLDLGLKDRGRRHDASPGQGSATAARRLVSTLA